MKRILVYDHDYKKLQQMARWYKRDHGDFPGMGDDWNITATLSLAIQDRYSYWSQDLPENSRVKLLD